VEAYQLDKYPRHIKLIEWSSISTDRHPKYIRGNKYPRHIGIDKIRSSISGNKYPRHIGVDKIRSSIRRNKYSRHIQLIEIGVLFGEINIQDISVLIEWSSINVDKYPKHINVDTYSRYHC
jgi:hypothetical protein